MIDSGEIPSDDPSTSTTSNNNTINIINSLICRLCGNDNINDKLIGIYSEEGISNQIAYKINEYLPIKVQENDDLPLHCCLNCTSTLLAWHELFITTITTANRFQDYLNNKQIVVDVTFVETKNIVTEPPPTTTTQRLTTILDESSVDDDHLLTINHNSPISYNCEYCEIIFDNQTQLDDHIIHHKSMRKIKSKPLIIKPNQLLNVNCHTNRIDDNNDCNYKIESNDEFNKFANLTTKMCTKCNIIFRTKTLLKKHVSDKHHVKMKRSRRKKSEIIPKFFCDSCEKGFTRKSDMEKHKKLKHSNDETNENSPTNDDDDDATKKLKNHEILKRCKITDTDDGKIYYKCDICSRIFKQSYNMIRHRTIHTGVRSYCCHMCGKSFRMSNGLNRHINEHHLGIKKYKCDICTKRFCSRATFDEHLNIHTGERPYVCDICGKTFRQKGSLHIHKTFHTDNYRFKCDICDKKFRRNQELKHHSWIHSGYKPYKCNKCNTGFRWRNDLKRHQRIHEKATIVEIVCQICGLNFIQERYLKAHMRIHLNDEKIKQEIDTPKTN